MKEEYRYLPIAEEENELNIRTLLMPFLRKWYWFIFSILAFVALGVTYLKFAPKSYQSVASIIVQDEDKQGSSGSTELLDLGALGGIKTNSIANEIGLLKSKRLMYNTVKALKLNVKYLEDANLFENELYDKSPLFVEILKLDEKKLNIAVQQGKHRYRIYPKSESIYNLQTEVTEEQREFTTGESITLDFVTFVVQENPEIDFAALDLESILVQFTPLRAQAQNYSRKLQVELVEDNSTLIELRLNDGVFQKSQDILNQLIYEYNQEAIEDKNLIAKNTASFIDERLRIINQELDSVETGKEQFKEQNRLTDIGAESNMLIQNVSEYNRERQKLENQLELTNSLLSYVDNNNTNLFPSNLGLEDVSTNSLIEEYNQLVLKREKLLVGSTENNPVVVNLTNQINQLKGSLRSSLKSTQGSLFISADNLRKKSGALGFQMAQIPGQERQVRGIERQQGIKESLYLYLLQKREENTLSLKVTAPKAKVVDEAYSVGGGTSPSPKVVLGGALALGVLLPFLVIRGGQLLNDKIMTRTDVERTLHDTSILGELPKLDRKQPEFIVVNDRSILSETFRILVANLQYTLKNVTHQQAKTIGVTSTIKGEGKTFVSVNTAVTLALSGKKVLLIGCDLRNSQLHRYEKAFKNRKGLSDYLMRSEAKSVEDFIYTATQLASLDILPAGTIPPNPAELFQQEKMAQLFHKLQQQYDYIVLDTPPAMLLADTFLLNTYIDVSLYVLRSGVTKKTSLQFIKELEDKGRLPNIKLVINDLKLGNLGYGNKYGYAYGSK
ncbi:GumC family protein [Croceivirga sp. JEA036]|uniref:GumC family protein n=1 Tax=Croceivirga sp. JEA036 TaxID=2721162 RepID=UPI00143C0FB8|nr:polysaccharide biosynthesis tyrosine autokinase [Croceivirga sp. JEA036]NJB35400.1 polysaccharide biosynthesis tyrosine autokinase [Croceivirga sp. JEA036]